VEPAHDLAAQPDGVDLVDRQVVGETETRACIEAPPSSSSVDSSPVAIFTSGGPPRKTLERCSIMTT